MSSTDGPPVRVIAFHMVDHLPGHPLEPYSVTPAQFTLHVESLRDEGWQIIDLPAYLDHVAGAPARRPSVLLTFDDGYHSLLDHAVPVLETFDIRPVVAVVTGLIGATNEWDAQHGGAPLPLLTSSEIDQLRAAGWSIVSHTMRHEHLHGRPVADLAEDYLCSRQATAGAAPSSGGVLVYPYGEHNLMARRAVRKAGYEAAFALDVTRTGGLADRFALPRLEVKQDMTTEALLQLLEQPNVGRQAQWRREAGVLARCLKTVWKTRSLVA
jgi:peptidoglycan/xylan/chitin deacetylase (PgdA/CDA1 family)